MAEIPPVPQSAVQAASQPRSNRRLSHVGAILLAVTLGYFAFEANIGSAIALDEGLVIIVLSAWPVLLWARRAAYEFPVFEVFILTGINLYALPLLNGQVQTYPESIIEKAAGVVLFFQAIAIFAYITTRGHARTTPFWTEEVISHDIGRYLGYGLILTTIYTGVANMTDIISADLEGPLRAIFYGIGIISTFVQGRRWGQGDLNQQEKIFFAVNIFAQVLLNFVSLFLITGISILVLAILGYVSSSKRLPLVLLIVLFPVIAVLHNGKTEMREKYWENHEAAPGLLSLPAFFTEWFQDGLKLHPKTGLTGKLIERTSLFQMICLVVDNTPDRLPFLDGETYAQIPGQFVPRFFWSDKPVGHISTYTLSVYYGLQRPEDTKKTTIAFGLLSEAYANFGFYGVGLIAALFGFGLKKISLWSQNSPLLSYGGLLLVLLMAWSFQTELTLSIWLSSLFQATVAVLGVPFVLRHLLG